ncbi:MAG: hypothetical protein ACHQ53_08990 [Polyangiales bacterium]
MEHDEPLLASEQLPDDDIHDRDTIPVPHSVRAAAVEIAQSGAARRDEQADSDGPPTLRAPAPLGHRGLERAVVADEEASRPTRPGLLTAPTAIEITDGDASDPSALDEDDTRPYRLDDPTSRIPIARVPRELESVVVKAATEPDAPAETTSDARDTQPAPPIRSLLAIVENAPSGPAPPLAADTTSSLAPAVRPLRPEPKGSAGAAVLLLAALVPFASGLYWMTSRPMGVAAATRSATALAPRADRVETSLTATTRAGVDAPLAAPASAPPAPAEVEPSPTLAAVSLSEPEAPLADPQNAGRERPRRARKPTLGETGGVLPEAPDRAAVVAALEPLREAVAGCAAGRHGIAEADISVNGSGSVAHAVVEGDFAGSPQGSCIARALRQAHFAPFQQSRFRVLYPFSL